MTLIVGVTSLARAGKDTLAQRLCSLYSFTQLNMSDILKDELIRQKRDPTKDNMSIIGDELRSQYGKDIVIRKLLEKAAAYENVVITGLRSPEEVIYLRNNSPNLFLIAISSPLELRFKRRNELDPKTLEEFAFRDERDIKNKGLDKVIAMADYNLNNLDSLELFYDEIDRVMSSINQITRK